MQQLVAITIVLQLWTEVPATGILQNTITRFHVSEHDGQRLLVM